MLNNAKKIIDINRTTLGKVKNFLGINQETVIRVSVLAAFYFLIPQIGFAATLAQVPGGNALNTFSNWVTGPIPTAVGAIAIGSSGAMLAFGEMGPAAKKTLQVVLGTGCAMQAPNLVSLAGTSANGLFF